MMNNKSKNILIYLLILLFAINIAALVTIVSINKRSCYIKNQDKKEFFKGSDHFQKFIQKDLGLSEEQMILFRANKEEFIIESRDLSRQMKKQHDALIEELKKDNPDTSRIDELTQLMGANFVLIKQLSNQHFLSMKEILTKEQQEIFFSKMKKGYHDFGSGPGSKKHHKRQPYNADCFN